MIGYLDIEDAQGDRVQIHRTVTRWLTGSPGLPGVLGKSGARQTLYTPPARHGARVRQRYLKEQPFSLEGVVRGTTPQQAQAELDDVIAVLFDALAAERTARYRRGTDGPELQAGIRLGSDDVAVQALDGVGRLLRYQAHVLAPDPRAYSQEIAVAQSAPMGATGGGGTFPATYPTFFNPGSAGHVLVTNSGAVATPPVYELVGYLLNPAVVLGDQQLRINGEVAAGNRLQLDVANRRAVLNGVADRQSLVDWSVSTWIELPRGTSNLQLIAEEASADAALNVYYRHAY